MRSGTADRLHQALRAEVGEQILAHANHVTDPRAKPIDEPPVILGSQGKDDLEVPGLGHRLPQQLDGELSVLSVLRIPGQGEDLFRLVDHQNQGVRQVAADLFEELAEAGQGSARSTAQTGSGRSSQPRISVAMAARSTWAISVEPPRRHRLHRDQSPRVRPLRAGLPAREPGGGACGATLHNRARREGTRVSA